LEQVALGRPRVVARLQPEVAIHQYFLSLPVALEVARALRKLVLIIFKMAGQAEVLEAIQVSRVEVEKLIKETPEALEVVRTQRSRCLVVVVVDFLRQDLTEVIRPEMVALDLMQVPF
jgi:hypothetical protein